MPNSNGTECRRALHPGPVEAGALVEAEHYVHVLHGLAASSLLDSTRMDVVLSIVDGRGLRR